MSQLISNLSLFFLTQAKVITFKVFIQLRISIHMQTFQTIYRKKNNWNFQPRQNQKVAISIHWYTICIQYIQSI